jgi:putative FmdB family regulatory protein
MPTYIYKCPECKLEYEVRQRITEEPLEECAMCHGAKPVRLISATNFVLNGPGWYKDGYGSKK